MSGSLVEPGVKYFISETLKNCNKAKMEYYSTLLNIFLFTSLITIVGMILYFNYKTDDQSYKQREKMRKQEEYLANVIHKVKREQQRERGQMITNIPEFESLEHIQDKKFL